MIKVLTNAEEKKTVARLVLEALPDWFGVPESTENYISQSARWEMFAAYDNEKPVGFVCLKETGKDTIELAVMGVLKEYHRKGIGTQLFEAANKIATDSGYSFMQVKTVQLGIYPDYDITNRFYQACGFKELEVIKEIWGEENPCQIYVRYLK